MEQERDDRRSKKLKQRSDRAWLALSVRLGDRDSRFPTLRGPRRGLRRVPARCIRSANPRFRSRRYLRRLSKSVAYGQTDFRLLRRSDGACRLRTLRNWSDQYAIVCDSPVIVTLVENMLGAVSESDRENRSRGALSRIET